MPIPWVVCALIYYISLFITELNKDNTKKILSAANAGGPGAACGICYKLTPVSASGEALTQQAMTFMIIDECPVSPIPINNNNCGMCKTGDKNIFNQEWHFDIAVDAMNQSQYDLFFKGVTYGS